MNRSSSILILVIGIVSFGSGQSSLHPMNSSTDVVAPHSLFGFCVDADSAWAAISAPFAPSGEKFTVGTVTMYSKANGWNSTQTITAPEVHSMLTFGMSVALSGTTLAIGAPGDNEAQPFSGCVYLYTRIGNEWQLSLKIKAPDASVGARFGTSVDIYNDILIVGASQAFGTATKSGTAYVFHRTSGLWQFVQKVLPPAILSGGAFGSTVHVLDDTLFVVGGSSFTGSSDRTGTVTVFSRSDSLWAQTSHISLSDGNEGDQFGYSITSNSEYLAVGSPGRNSNGMRSGEVYVFNRSNWQLTHILPCPSPTGNDNFGLSLAMTSEYLYVGSTRSNGNEKIEIGRINTYAIAGTVFTPGQMLTVDDADDYDHFGTRIAATGDIIVVTSPYRNIDSAANAGRAYFFTQDVVNGVKGEEIPLTYSLQQNYPNPFNPTTHIDFSLKEQGRVHLVVFNVLGQVVRTLVDEARPAGRYSVGFETRNLATGVYFYRIDVNDFVSVRKMLIMK